MRIRPMTYGDLEQTACIEEICFRESWSASLLKESMESPWNVFLVAQEGEELIGYGTVCVIAGEGEIQRIAVLPAFRQKGLGRELLAALEKTAKERGARAVTLEVRESNFSARRLYVSAGFMEEGRRKGYYRNPEEDAIIMWKRQLS